MGCFQHWTAKDTKTSEQQEGLLSSPHDIEKHTSSHLLRQRQFYLVLTLTAMAAILGFLTGQLTTFVRLMSGSQVASNYEKFYQMKNFTVTFNENEVFTSPPSAESNEAWDDLFPLGMGYASDPRGEVNVVAISMFHQLHCLNLFRHMYYEKVGVKMEPQSMHLSAAHGRHCLDYLRQAIMCQADSNVEPVDDESLSVVANGVEHKCMDYKALKKWTEENRIPKAP